MLDEKPAPNLHLRMNDVEVRLAETEADVRAAQQLRYRVFYEEQAAQPNAEMAESGRDFDDFDSYCDHLLVIDHAMGAGPESVVGTYRFMRRGAAAACGRWYSAGEYDIGAVIAYPGEIMELGRSCVSPSHRDKSTMNLLWRAIAEYVNYYEVQIMFGCGSLQGVDPDSLALPLSYLFHYHLAPENVRVRALDHLFVEMNRMPIERIDAKRTLAALPPLIKGYVRLGGFVGDGAVVDPQFNTTDVFVTVKTELVTGRYMRHYTRDSAQA